MSERQLEALDKLGQSIRSAATLVEFLGYCSEVAADSTRQFAERHRETLEKLRQREKP